MRSFGKIKPSLKFHNVQYFMLLLAYLVLTLLSIWSPSWIFISWGALARPVILARCSTRDVFPDPTTPWSSTGLPEDTARARLYMLASFDGTGSKSVTCKTALQCSLFITLCLGSIGINQGSYRQVCVKFKDFIRTSLRLIKDFPTVLRTENLWKILIYMSIFSFRNARVHY